MHVFVSRKPLSPVRWHQAFPDSLTYRSPADVKASFTDGGVIWLDFTRLDPAERMLWLDQSHRFQVPIVVLSNMPNDDEATLVFRSGGCGYCHVLAAPEQLKQIARVVANGGYWVGSDFIQKVLKISAKHISPSGESARSRLYNSLTEREQMVAQLVAKGATNREAASALGITERTIKAHMASIFAKSGARDRIHLVLMLTEKDSIPK